MQAFEIQLPDKGYLVEPQENGTFRIMDGEEKVLVIYPEVSELGTEWKTMGRLEEGFVFQIGELISEHHMQELQQINYSYL